MVTPILKNNFTFSRVQVVTMLIHGNSPKIQAQDEDVHDCIDKRRGID